MPHSSRSGLGGVASAQTWTEPKSGVAFAVKKDDMTLLGGGLRVKKMVFTFKAYAIGFYVSDAALAGPLAAYKGDDVAGALQGAADRRLQEGSRPRFMRNLSQSRIQEAMRESLAGAEPKVLDQFISYFPELKEGQECVLRWAPGGNARDRHGRPGEAADRRPGVHRAAVRPVRRAHADPGGHQGRGRGAPRAAPAAAAVLEANGNVKSVQPNGFTMTDANGKELVLTADGHADRRKGASHKMDQLKADGKPPTVGEFIAAQQRSP